MAALQHPLDYRQFTDAEYGERKEYVAMNQRFNRARQCYGLREDQWPTVSETPDDYRLRLMRQLQPHTSIPKNNLAALRDDPQALDRMEKLVIREAIADIGLQGKLVEIKDRDHTGREISTFEGSLDSWFSAYRAKPQRMAKLNGKEFTSIPLA